MLSGISDEAGSRVRTGEAMNITVKLFASFRAGRFAERQFGFPDGSTAGRVLAELGIGADETAILLANGRHITLADALADGDTLSVFPLIGGG
jgi:molybdopterin converting factor small subunit